MTIQDFIDLIPYRKKRYFCRKAGIDKDSLRRWTEKKHQPSTLSIIYLSMALSKELGLDFNKLLLQGIKAAARIKNDRIFQEIHDRRNDTEVDTTEYHRISNNHEL